MKTLRQLLFEKHQAAESDLDEIRRRIVSAHFRPTQVAGPTAGSAPGRARIGLARLLWHELVWPCRRAWIGLAAVWVVILGLNHAGADSSASVARAKAEPLSPAVLTLLREQRELAKELEGPVEASPSEPAPPRPRSELGGKSYEQA